MKFIRGSLALLGLAALAGCDIPTEVPILEQTWILPVRNTTISVSELLPAGVTVSGNNFSVSVSPFSTSRSLGDLCPACALLPQGAEAPAPAFSGTFTVSQPLPDNVASATLASGSVAIAVQNGFSFDPTAGGGSVVVTLTDGPGGRQIGQETFSGPMAKGSTTTRTLTLAPGAVGDTLVATVVVTSNGGQLATINASDRMTVTATPQAILASSARVDVAGRSVTIDPVDLDVEDIDDAIIDRIQSGSIVLTIANPFGVSVAAQIDINFLGGPISRTLNIGSSATSTASLTYEQVDFKKFLGQPNVQLTGSGTVSSSAGTITVTPGQQVVIDATIDIALRIGG